ncbi:hypothetical protein BDV95DRAFT_574221 [Massariosphaeria phaeospora]|uniref:Short chain dehydrogenase n=1 Tax=Massariosphaeria phaeospora TaxID=100035 RepID=A0A7C8IDR1_9PLEO|nr:hypothetical protein BDV95DRAFT_574221 [Massariosphaeria phaeospora]
MPTYVITGVSKGLGWEFLNQLSSDSSNTVIGLVRNKPATEKRVAEELSGRTNITILHGDLVDYSSLEKAAADTAAITGGSIDYLIANAAQVTEYDAYRSIDSLATDPGELTKQFRSQMETNVLANIYLYHLFMPLILEGKIKKVVFISSGMGDLELTRNFNIDVTPVYSTTKAAMNMINAKFSARYKKEGVLFLSICPGMVDVGKFSEVTAEQGARLGETVGKFKMYAPDWQGPDTPPSSVKAVLSVVNQCSLENGDSGAFLSHYGDKQWLK